VTVVRTSLCFEGKIQ